jgi:hypothetical protein
MSKGTPGLSSTIGAVPKKRADRLRQRCRCADVSQIKLLTICETYVIVVATAVSRCDMLFENQAYFSFFSVLSVVSMENSPKVFHETAKSGARAIESSVYQGLSAPNRGGAVVAQTGAVAQIIAKLN